MKDFENQHDDRPVVFWMGPGGTQRIWEPWDETTRRRWRKRHPEMECPGGRWEKTRPGHFLRRALKDATVVRELAERILGGSKGKSLRQLFAEATGEDWGRYPQHSLLLGNLYAEAEPELIAGQEHSEVPRLWAWLLQARAFICPLGRRVGWLVEAPNPTVAAAWELALLVAYNVWWAGVVRCQTCGGLFLGRRAAECPDCRARAPARPTERRRFLNLLSQWVGRGKLTDQERQAIKNVLEEHGVGAAKEALETMKEARCEAVQTKGSLRQGERA